MSSINITKDLINLIKNYSTPKVNIDSLLEGAKKNKILLHVLRILNIQGPLRDSQESAMKRVLKTVDILSRILRPYDYAFFKLIKPISYVPADIDLLIRVEHFREVQKKIMEIGYKIVVKDPYCATLVKGDSIIDLYIHPSLGGMIFLNGQRLLDHVTAKEFNGFEVRILESHLEALVVACHAVYKERLYTLNDYITINNLLTKKSLELAKEYNCERVINLVIILNNMIASALVKMPYKIPLQLWSSLLLEKFGRDIFARTTSLNMLKTFSKRHGITQFLEKITRETY